MAIDTTTPRSRRALLFGALGGAVAALSGLAKPDIARAGVDGDLVLEATNNTDAQTELIANTGSPGFRVLGTGIALQGWGGIGVDAYGQTIGVNGVSDGSSAPASIGFNRANSVGVLGWSANGNQSTPTLPTKTGVFGIAGQDDASARGVVGKTTAGQGVRGEATGGTGVVGESASGPGIEGRGSVGVRGASGATAFPGVPILAGVLGAGEIGVFGSSDGTVGVLGHSGGGTPTLYTKTGVHGFAVQDSLARGVLGESTVGHGVHGAATSGEGVHGEATSGQGIRGEATTGIGVKAVAVSGAALDVAGRAVFSRSGVAVVPKNATLVDVTVPGGLAGNPMALATLQIRRGSAHVLAARPNYPSAGKVRIYLSAVASTTGSTPVAWWVLG
jgi:hypothetical protein